MTADLDAALAEAQQTEGEQIKDLRRALDRAQKRLDEYRRNRNDYIDVVYQAAHDAATTLTIPPVKAPAKDTRKKNAETAIVVLSDFQLGKVTPSYDSPTCAARVALMAEKVAALTAIQRSDHPVDECVIYLLGDLIEGCDIFPGQQWRIDSGLYRQAVSEGPRILADFIRKMAAVFPKVRVVGVIGNHGRIGRKGQFHPEDNGDAILYEVARLMTDGEAGVEWRGTHFQPGESAWYAVDEVRGKRFLLFHGNQIKGALGLPWYGVQKKLGNWSILSQQMPELMERFDYALFGHWHTPTRLYLNGVTAWCNGSTESYNTYAIESLAAAGTPSQTLLFCNEKGITAEYVVRLGED